MAVGLALALIASLVAAVAADANPKFHRWLHKDADTANHCCLVTLLANGKISAPATAAILAFVAELILQAPMPAVERPLSRFLWRASLARAPPPPLF